MARILTTQDSTSEERACWSSFAASPQILAEHSLVKIELFFFGLNSHHVWRTKCTAHHPKKTPYQKWSLEEKYHCVRLFFCIRYEQMSDNWKEDTWKDVPRRSRKKSAARLPEWWSWNKGERFSKTVIPNPEQRKLSINLLDWLSESPGLNSIGKKT